MLGVSEAKAVGDELGYEFLQHLGGWAEEGDRTVGGALVLGFAGF